MKGSQPSRGGGAPAFDRRTFSVSASAVVLITAGLGAWLLAIAGRLPNPIASHWSGSGAADGFAGVGTSATLGVAVSLGTGLLVGGCLSLNSLASGLRRAGVALTVVFTAFMAMIFVAGLAPQIGKASAVGTVMDWGLVWAGLGIALAAGILLAFLVPARPLEAFDGGLPGSFPGSRHEGGLPRGARVDAAAAGRGESASCRIRATPGMYAVVGGIAFVALAVLAFASPWWLLGGAALAAAVVSFMAGTVSASSDGLSVRVWGRWRIVHIPVAAYGSARAIEDIEPMRYGGWGYRAGSWGTAFVVRRGPGLVVSLAGGREFVVNADTMWKTPNAWQPCSTATGGWRKTVMLKARRA
ncbi:hypothetical protein QO003_000708 [Arthrobacter silviterrae]|uniref:DUF1648 domain-containing protein n=1 Tax=Arthrobacter silviterrae TaxID=2026658 RepID=A0ABX0DDC3_9MICC|nr:DUF1648 domain-containing protein [Arthrobacter silviterrae]MDQ0276405.1 hypothetical protein [Arthrobacter silviterrae]NGN82415.1 hypothetical protein [Arthrobacter silviterrae]